VFAIALTPEGGDLQIEMRGDPTGLLAVSFKTKARCQRRR
jgi:hypothetical protein